MKAPPAKVVPPSDASAMMESTLNGCPSEKGVSVACAMKPTAIAI
jgi:hypothetical protein